MIISAGSGRWTLRVIACSGPAQIVCVKTPFRNELCDLLWNHPERRKECCYTMLLLRIYDTCWLSFEARQHYNNSNSYTPSAFNWLKSHHSSKYIVTVIDIIYDDHKFMPFLHDSIFAISMPSGILGQMHGLSDVWVSFLPQEIETQSIAPFLWRVSPNQRVLRPRIPRAFPTWFQLFPAAQLWQNVGKNPRNTAENPSW